MKQKTNFKTKKSQHKTKVRKFKAYDKAILVAVVAVVVYFLFFPDLFTKKIISTEYKFKKEGTLSFTDSLGNVKAKIDIQFAENDYDRELGLMFRKSMQKNRGMLFIFPQENIQNFWMHNTYIPLDMIFINSKDKIVTIQNADKTLSDQKYSSSVPATYVLEVNLGFSNKYNIKVGDKITWSRTPAHTE